MTRGPLLDGALDAAAAGLRVHPLFEAREDGSCACATGAGCDQIGKHPRLADWPRRATTDERTILHWWSRWPSANVGAVVDPPYVVVDIDDRALLNGAPLPETLSETTSRGEHRWYRAPDGARAQPRPGADIRQGGTGYVVIAPSRHASGVRYAWQGPLDLARAVELPPEWLAPPAAEHAEGHAGRFTLPAVIGEGARHTTLIAYLGALRRDVADDALVRAAVEDANAGRCRPPLGSDELETLVRSGLRDFAPEPRIVFEFDEEPERERAGQAEPWLRLPPAERVVAPPRWLDPFVCDSRSMLFGAQGAGKSVIAAAAIAALVTGDADYLPGARPPAPRRVGILDYEDNQDEWAERLYALGVAPQSVPYLLARVPLTRAKGLARARDWCRDEGLELVVIDSVIPAAGAADAMKPEGPTAFYGALAQLGVASWALAHVPKDKAAADHPFGSTYWSTPQRLVWRVEKVEAEHGHVVRLVNTKHSRWPWSPSLVLEVDWRSTPLRVRQTGVLLTDEALPLIDRIVAAIATEGRPLTADELGDLVGSTAQAVRVQAGRHGHRLVSDGARPRRYRVAEAV